jgi:hypothetical protein
LSIQAITWAIEDAPDVPPHLVGTLIGLANHADRDGRGAYPSQETLTHYNRKAPRQTKRDLDDLQSRGLIRQGDQRFVAHYRPDRRPIVWDLALERVRPRGVTHDTSPAHGVSSMVERGVIHGQNGVSPTTPKPSLEPKEEPRPSSPANADEPVDVDLLGRPVKTEPLKNASHVVQAWFDGYKKTGVKPPKHRGAQVGAEANRLIKSGNDIDVLARAAFAAGEQGWWSIERQLTAQARNGSGRNGRLSQPGEPLAERRRGEHGEQVWVNGRWVLDRSALPASDWRRFSEQ